MKNVSITRFAVLAASIALSAATGFAGDCSSAAGADTSDSGAKPAAHHNAKAEKDIVDTAVAAKFSTLAAAVKAGGLVETLKGKGPFTVFAPTDEAFKKLPEGTLDSLLKPENKEKLVAILTYHVVPGKVTAEDVAKLTSAKTVNGKELPIKVEGDKVSVGSATVIKTDVAASNGVIHVIDTVLLPPEK